MDAITRTKASKTGDFKMVVVDPKQKVDTSMEEGSSEQSPLQGATAPPQIVSVMKVTQHDDKDKTMKSEVLDILHLDTRGKKDLLHEDDIHK